MDRFELDGVLDGLEVLQNHRWLDLDPTVAEALWKARECLNEGLSHVVGPWEPDRAFRYDGRKVDHVSRAIRRLARHTKGSEEAMVSMEWDRSQDTYTLCEGSYRDPDRRGTPFGSGALVKKIGEMEERLRSRRLVLVPGPLPFGWVDLEALEGAKCP